MSTLMQTGDIDELDIVPYTIAMKLPELGYDIGSNYCYVKEKNSKAFSRFKVETIKGPYCRGGVHTSIDLENFQVISAPTIMDFLAWAFKKGVKLSIGPSTGMFWHIKDKRGYVRHTKVVAALSYRNLMRQVAMYALLSLEAMKKEKENNI